jgi:hypothetical protein
MDNARPHPLTLLRPTDCTPALFAAAMHHLTGDNAGWNPGTLQGFVYDADGFDPYCVVPSGCQSRWWVERVDADFAEAHDTLGEALGAIEAHRAGDLDDDPVTSKPRD